MSRLRLCNFGMSIDGFSAGTDQDVHNPLGVRGPEIMEWFFPTLTFRSMHGLEGGGTWPGRPDLMAGRKSLTVYSGMTGMMENAFINVKNRSVTLTAEVEIPARGANGVILAQGGRFGGWSLYLKDGKPAYTYNFVGLEQFTITGTQRVPPGKATIVMDFAYDGDGRGKGGTVTLSINGKPVGSGRVERTEANIFSADEGADVGRDDGTNVSSGYGQYDNEFTGTIEKVTVDVK